MSTFQTASLLIVFNQPTAFQEVTISTLFNFQKSDNFKSIKVTIHIFLIKKKLARIIANFIV